MRARTAEGRRRWVIETREDLERASALLHDGWFDPKEDIEYDEGAGRFRMSLWREMDCSKGDPESDEGRYMRCRLVVAGVTQADIKVDRWPVLSSFMQFRYDEGKGVLELEILGTASVRLHVASLRAELVDTGEVVDDPRRL